MGNKKTAVHLMSAALLLLLLCVDQITKKIAAEVLPAGDKVLIPKVLSLHYLENRGAAWGILQNAFWLFFIITIAVTGLIAVFYMRVPFEKRYFLLRFTILLLGSGAIGNFIDRAIRHYVVDFIYFECINFPVFNFADCYVTISAVLLIYCLIFKYKDEEFIWKKS